MTEAEGLIAGLRKLAADENDILDVDEFDLLVNAATALQQAIAERDEAIRDRNYNTNVLDNYARQFIPPEQDQQQSKSVFGIVGIMEGLRTRAETADAQLQRLTASLEDAGTFTPVGWRYRYNRMGSDQPWHFSQTDPGELQDGYVKEPIYRKGDAT